MRENGVGHTINVKLREIFLFEEMPKHTWKMFNGADGNWKIWKVL
jgi:hypothetical protein